MMDFNNLDINALDIIIFISIIISIITHVVRPCNQRLIFVVNANPIITQVVFLTCYPPEHMILKQ